MKHDWRTLPKLIADHEFNRLAELLWCISLTGFRNRISEKITDIYAMIHQKVEV